MKSKENLVFIGMMGSGKSSIGSMVSKKLNLNFFDIDQLIENDQKMKISKIFEIKGEAFFRDIEKKITLNILKNKRGVIALGGGAFITRAIKNEVIENHLSFWLNWNIDTLIPPTRGGRSEAPHPPRQRSNLCGGYRGHRRSLR